MVVDIEPKIKNTLQVENEININSKSHANLVGLDYESSGHTGFASSEELEKVKAYTQKYKFLRINDLATFQNGELTLILDNTNGDFDNKDLSCAVENKIVTSNLNVTITVKGKPIMNSKLVLSFMTRSTLSENTTLKIKFPSYRMVVDSKMNLKVAQTHTEVFETKGSNNFSVTAYFGIDLNHAKMSYSTVYSL